MRWNRQYAKVHRIRWDTLISVRLESGSHFISTYRGRESLAVALPSVRVTILIEDAGTLRGIFSRGNAADEVRHFTVSQGGGGNRAGNCRSSRQRLEWQMEATTWAQTLTGKGSRRAVQRVRGEGGKHSVEWLEPLDSDWGGGTLGDATGRVGGSCKRVRAP